MEDHYEGDDGQVALWEVLLNLLGREITDWPGLLDLLETISTTIRGSSAAAGDYGTLQSAIEIEPDFFSDTWPAIVRFALALPSCFSAGILGQLLPGDTVTLTRNECASLVAHQFLCSVEPQRADFYDFSIWYDSNQRHPAAIAAYLKGLFAYFRLRGKEKPAELDSEVINYTLASADLSTSADARGVLAPLRWSESKLLKIQVTDVPSHSTTFLELEYQGSDGAVVISSNKDIGFGQSATQEELHVGATPEACAAVLFTPRLELNQALNITGAQPVIRFTGQRRDISCQVIEPAARGGRMLFMDALEIDLIDAGESLPDLLDENIIRELGKAFVAFSSWPVTADSTIWSGLWGCGAFNGEPTVKLLILWAAASLAGRRLQVLLDTNEADFSSAFRRLIDSVPAQWTVADIIALLRQAPTNTKRGEVIQWCNDYNEF